MKRKTFVALAVTPLTVILAIQIAAFCGSTWVTAPPVFGPTLTNSNCIVGNNQYTETSKSVATLIYWTVGLPLPVVVTDNGQNYLYSGGTCLRCFPIFYSPEWIELQNGTVTEWSQITQAVRIAGGGCDIDYGRDPQNHHYGRTCATNEETCELVNEWFWNFLSSTCTEEQQYCNQNCTPYQPLESGGCNSPVDYCEYQWGCDFSLTDGGQGCCCGATPIVVDVAGNGFNLTDAYSGVNFDLGGDGRAEPVSWTSAESDDAWLVLDRNNNGNIDSGKELFGNFTDQPHASTTRNGFVALAEFDRVDNGGNNDGQITNQDAIFGSLKLWQDTNHNGVSESGELQILASSGIANLELDYKSSKKDDGNGNQFDLRAKVKDQAGNQVGRWAWDVTLHVNPPPQP